MDARPQGESCRHRPGQLSISGSHMGLACPHRDRGQTRGGSLPPSSEEPAFPGYTCSSKLRAEPLKHGWLLSHRKGGGCAQRPPRALTCTQVTRPPGRAAEGKRGHLSLTNCSFFSNLFLPSIRFRRAVP